MTTTKTRTRWHLLHVLDRRDHEPGADVAARKKLDRAAEKPKPVEKETA